MNAYDSLRMQDLMAPHGYEPTETVEEADLAILNTCHIREKASEKMYSEIGKIKKLREKHCSPDHKLTLAVAGCVGQAEGDEIFQRAPYVNIVVGPQSYHSLPELVAKINRKEKHLIDLDFVEEEKFDKLPVNTNDQGVSAIISVQEGCDKFCAFCVVPYTRGAEFSRPFEKIYREVLELASNGAKEITLLGQNVNGYHGLDLNGNTMNLASLIRNLEKIENIERIRYMTSHPIDMDDDLIDIHGSSSKLMPFIHLPVQSGSNKILKAMNRKHTREEYLEIIKKLRASRPDIAISSDFIVGFPGETDEDFADTVDLVKQVEFSQCFSFKYSPRPGTPAAVKIQVPEEVKVERLKILQDEIQKHQLEFNKSCVGKTLPVLFYRDGKFSNQIIGRTPYMQSLHIDNVGEDYFGKIVDVKITKAQLSSLSGDV